MGYDLSWRDDRDNPNAYFRFTVFDMPVYRDYMFERRMLADIDLPTSLPVEAFVNTDSGTIIPSYKLCSNDGWWITPAEIARALMGLRYWEGDQRRVYGDDWQDPLQEDDAVFQHWLVYLSVARDHGGVIVR